MRLVLHLGAALALTALTQIGGLAWLASLGFRRRVPAFLAGYALLWALAWNLAPLAGRVPLGCGQGGPLQMQSWFYCLANRNYVVPELAAAAADLAVQMDKRHPGTVTLVLDGNSPFVSGFPLFPHLSHDDGRKLDLAFCYADRQGRYLPGATRSPLGYFAFEDGPTSCPPRRFTLRWDFRWLQSRWPDTRLDRPRTAAMLGWLARDPRIGRVFVEPHLRQTLGVTSAKFGFQGCHAARHDDHLHIQL